MQITVTIQNTTIENVITVATEGNEKQINIPGKPTGGSAVNGGELLFASLATCFCNDLYREAAKRNMKLDRVDVSVSGKFGKEGEPGFDIVYRATVQASGSTQQQIDELINHVDSVAEIHNTLRKGVAVTLQH